MARNTEHNFTLAGEEYHLSFIDKPILLKNGKPQKVLPILKKYVNQASLPVKLKNNKGKDKNTNTIANDILSHFTSTTQKTKTKKAVKKDSSKKIAMKAESQINKTQVKLELSENFKVVMICAKVKHNNTHISVNNQTIKFKAVSNPGNFDFLPDDPKPNDKCTWRKWVEDNQNNAIPALAYNLYIPQNPFNDVYLNLNEKFDDRLFILSAGWGLVKANFRLPNYDITFSVDNPANLRVFQNPNPPYNDFNHLTNNHNEVLIGRNEDIVFMGGRAYIEQFISLTENSINNKLIYYFGMNSPAQVLPLGFSYRKYFHPDATNYTWYYFLAQDYANGLTP